MLRMTPVETQTFDRIKLTCPKLDVSLDESSGSRYKLTGRKKNGVIVIVIAANSMAKAEREFKTEYSRLEEHNPDFLDRIGAVA